MGLRRRNEFDGYPVPEENLTKYDEKFTVPTDRSESFGAAQNRMYGSGTQSPVQTPAPDPTERNYVFGQSAVRDGRASVFSDSRSAPFNVVPPADRSAPSPSPSTREPDGAPREFNSAPVVSSERPMVFVLRDDENMFVYEYSDRLEYYRRTDVGMVHCATKYKAKAR